MKKEKIVLTEQELEDFDFTGGSQWTLRDEIYDFIEKIRTALVAHMLAFFVKLIIDTREDPTNHNLFPFEMAYYLFIDGVGSVILVLMGTYIRKLFRK